MLYFSCISHFFESESFDGFESFHYAGRVF